MTKFLKYSPLMLALVLGYSAYASAEPENAESARYDRDRVKPDPSTAPEMDPSLALTALSLIGGSLVVSRTRSAK